MSMPYNLPQRKSPRATWHDYNGGRYFVTFCTKNHDLYFGDVVDGKMVLSEIGEWTVKQIEQTAMIRQNDVEIPLFVVMPNHVHLIVVYNHVFPRRDASNASADIDASNAPACRDTSNVSADNASTDNASADKTSDNVPADARGITDARGVADARGETDARGASLQFGPQSGNLPSVVRGIKSAVTKYANEHDIPFAWQSRYHDHIIRNQIEMNHIAHYIQNNPMKWELDRFYKKR